MSNENEEARLNQLVDQLLERYSGEWENTPGRLFVNNFRALRTFCHSTRLGSVTNIVLCGLGTGGTRADQERNANDGLDPYLEYSQKIFFTQLAAVRLIRDLLQERHRLQPVLYACDPAFTQHDIRVLRRLNVSVIPTANREQRPWHDRGTLIYDVTQDTDFPGRRIDLTWHGSRVPPAAIITCVTGLVRNRVAPRPGDAPKEVNPAFLRKYYMMPLMDLHRRTAPSSAERRQVEAIRDTEQQAAARAELRERESMATKAAYEQMLVTHDAVMDQFEVGLDQRALELRHYYQSVGDREGYQNADRQAQQELTPQTPRVTNSYVYDPMMVLLYRKPAPTAQPM